MSSESENAVQNKAITKKFDTVDSTINNMQEKITEVEQKARKSNITVDSSLSSSSENPVQNKVVNEAINVAENMTYVLGYSKSSYEPNGINNINTKDLNDCIAKSYIYAVYCNPAFVENTPYPEGENYGTCLCIPSINSTIQIYITNSVFYGENYKNGRVAVYTRMKDNNTNGEWTPWFSGMLGNNFYISNTSKYLNDIMLKFIGENSVIYVEDEDKMYLYDGTELKQILKS